MLKFYTRIHNSDIAVPSTERKTYDSTRRTLIHTPVLFYSPT